MKTVIGNWETDFVTTINVQSDTAGMYITQRQLNNALSRMNATSTAKLRFVPVDGALLDTTDFEVRNA